MNYMLIRKDRIMANSTVIKELLKDYDKKRSQALEDADRRKRTIYSEIPRLQNN